MLTWKVDHDIEVRLETLGAKTESSKTGNEECEGRW